MDNSNKRRWIWITIAIVVVVFIILAVLVDLNELQRTLKRTDFGTLLVGVVFLMLGIILITIRWRFLLPVKPAFPATFHATSISYLLKLLLPVPQAVTRLTTLSLASSISVYQSAPVMMIERFLEMVMRLVAITLAIVLILDIPLWIAGLGTAAILLFAIPAFLMWFTRNASTAVPRIITRSARLPDLSKEKLREAMDDFQNNVSTMRAARGITTSVIYSLAMWGLFLLFYASGFQALGLERNIEQIFAMAATVLAVLPPSTPAMIGVYQGIVVAILLPFGNFDVSGATAYALLMFGAQLLIWIVLGVWGFRSTDLHFDQLTQISLDDETP
jgi:uncharacterized protein (TIRG00374 family)